MSKATDRHPLAGRLLLAVVSLTLALGVAEIVLRIEGFRFRFQPERVEFGYPNPKEIENLFEPDDRLLWVSRDYRHKVEVARETHPDWLLMGDSVTAWQRYDEMLAEHLRHRGQNLTYVNLAVAGWSTYQGLEQMRTDVVSISPRIVTLYFGWNDHWIGFGVDDAEAAKINRGMPFHLEDLRLTQLAVKSAIALDLRSRPEAKPLRVAPEDFRSNLTEMIDIARRHGILPILLTAPTSHRKGREPRYLTRRWVEDLGDLVPLHQRYVAIVRDVAAENDALLCDLEASLSGLSPDQARALFVEDGIHLTPAGGRRIAALLDRCFSENGVYAVLFPPATGDGSETPRHRGPGDSAGVG